MNWSVANRRDVDFLLYEVLGAEDLLMRERFADHDRQSLDSALDLAFSISRDILFPNARKADAEEPYLEGDQVKVSPTAKAGVNAVVEAGFIAASGDFEDGGMQLPMVVTQACLGLVKGADPATVAYAMLTRAAANMLKAHASKEQQAKYMASMLEGRFFGTMCLSEPDVGSSLGDIKSSAVPHGDGSYRLRGNKMWISGADQDISENIIHLVLAKLPDAPAGARGLSLFIVPKWHVRDDGSLGERNDVRVVGLNHKLGYRATSNCALNFGESGNCIAYLVGKPHMGLAYMFHMMNEARVGVGTGSTMAGYAGYGEALRYAKERVQGRPLGAEPGSAPVPIINHPDVKRMLLQQKSYVEGGLALCLFGAFLIDEAATQEDQEQRETKEQILDVLTPIIKSWPAEYCLEANKLAMQVHGGYGYTRDFIVEKLYRDNRLNPIHEGTTWVQAQDFLGRKVRMAGGNPFHMLLDSIRCEIAAHEQLPQTSSAADALRTVLDQATDVIAEMAALQDAGKTEAALMNATNLLFAFGHIVIAWLWLWQSRVATAALEKSDVSDERNFYQGKLAAARYFFEFEMPQVSALLCPVAGGSTVSVEVTGDQL